MPAVVLWRLISLAMYSALEVGCTAASAVDADLVLLMLIVSSPALEMCESLVVGDT